MADESEQVAEAARRAEDEAAAPFVAARNEAEAAAKAAAARACRRVGRVWACALAAARCGGGGLSGAGCVGARCLLNRVIRSLLKSCHRTRPAQPLPRMEPFKYKL